MKRLLFWIILSSFSLTLNAQQCGEDTEETLKHITKLYNHHIGYVIVFDYSEGIYLGNTFEEFTERLKKIPKKWEEGFDDETAMLVKTDTIGGELPYFFKQYESEYYRFGFRRDTPENRSKYPFYIKIRIKRISPLAGIDATWQLIYEDSQYRAFTKERCINVRDGR